MKKHLHWTQTPAGKKKMGQIQKARWATSKNGATPPHPAEIDSFKAMEQVLMLYARLPQNERNYIRSRIA
jgi:hypothetical protein